MDDPTGAVLASRSRCVSLFEFHVCMGNGNNHGDAVEHDDLSKVQGPTFYNLYA
jgi:hypothetical protein